MHSLKCALRKGHMLIRFSYRSTLGENVCVCVCVPQTTTNQKWSLSSYHRLKLDISPSCWQKKIEEWAEKQREGYRNITCIAYKEVVLQTYVYVALTQNSHRDLEKVSMECIPIPNCHHTHPVIRIAKS